MTTADLFQSYIGPADPNVEQLRRLFLRAIPVHRGTPAAPRGLHIDKTNRNALVWEAPADMFGVTHFNVYVDSQAPQALFRQIPSSQLRMGEPVSGTRFFVTSFNFFNGEESSPAVVDNQVPIALNGIVLVGANATVTIDPQNGEVIVEDATVKTTIDDHQPTGGGTPSGGIGVLSKANLSQTTMASGFFVCLNKNGKPTVSIATIDETNAASAGIARVFDGSGAGGLGSGQMWDMDGNAHLMKLISRLQLLDAALVIQIDIDAVGKLIAIGAIGAAQALLGQNSLRTQNAANTRFSQLSSAGAVSGTDVTGAWSLDSTNGLVINTATAIDSLINGFLRSLKIGAIQTLDASNNADVLSLKINGVAAIDSSKNVDFASYKVGGVAGVTQSGNFEITGFSTTTLQYKDWTGTNQSQVIVTGITTAAASAFASGLKTA